MDGQMPVEREAFMRVMEGGRLRVMQMFNLAMLAGVLAFGAVPIILWFQQEGPVQTDAAGRMSLLGLLTIVHAVVALTAFPIGYWVHDRLVSPGGIAWQEKKIPLKSLSAEEKCAAGVFNAMVFRLLFFEWAAIFGLVVCLVGTQTGELAEMPVYWVNLFSPAVFVLLVIGTFPTRARVEELFVRRFTEEASFNRL